MFQKLRASADRAHGEHLQCWQAGFIFLQKPHANENKRSLLAVYAKVFHPLIDQRTRSRDLDFSEIPWLLQRPNSNISLHFISFVDSILSIQRSSSTRWKTYRFKLTTPTRSNLSRHRGFFEEGRLAGRRRRSELLYRQFKHKKAL